MKKLSPVLLSIFLSIGLILQSISTAFAAPYEIYGRVIMNSADYYLNTDIDEFGNARIFPSKTTFSAVDAVSGATTLADRFTLRVDEGQNAVYTYSPSRLQEYRDWAEKITRITYLSHDWAEIIRYVPSDLGYREQSDSLVLKTKDMPSGIYTVRIYSEGSDTFVLNIDIQKDAPRLSLTDGSGAASSAGGSGVDGISSASQTVPAFLVFNFDMLANAQILKQLNMETEASKAVLAWWEEANKEVVRGEGSMDLYDWEAYLESGKTFEDHVAGGGQRATAADGIFWDMWEVKNVLENGRLGDPYDFYEQIAAPYPEITAARADWNNGVVLTFGNATPDQFNAWAAGIIKTETDVSTGSAAVKVDSTGLYRSEYTINTANKQLILPKATVASRVSDGSTLTIRSSGYKTINHKITFASGVYTPKLGAAAYYVGDNVEIKNIPADIKSIHVKIGTSSLYNGSNSGSGSYFTLKPDGGYAKIIINSANFADAGTYFVSIQSSSHATQSIKVRLLDSADPGEQTGPADSTSPGEETPYQGLQKDITITIDDIIFLLYPSLASISINDENKSLEFVSMAGKEVTLKKELFKEAGAYTVKITNNAGVMSSTKTYIITVASDYTYTVTAQ